jgi:hypothetical protein
MMRKRYAEELAKLKTAIEDDDKFKSLTADKQVEVMTLLRALESLLSVASKKT